MGLAVVLTGAWEVCYNAVTGSKSGLSGLEGKLGTPQSQAISVVDLVVYQALWKIGIYTDL